MVRYPLAVRQSVRHTINTSHRPVQHVQLANSATTDNDEQAVTPDAAADDDVHDDDAQLSSAMLAETVSAVASDHGTVSFSARTEQCSAG